jgi:hypothetical protein
MTMNERQKLILGGSLAIALSFVAGASLDNDPTRRDDQLAGIGSAVAAGSAGSAADHIDGDAYAEAVRAAKRADPTLVDLLTAPVEPGAVVATGGFVPLGKRPAGVELTGAAVGRFQVEAVTFKDGPTHTWIEVRARNTSTQRLRLTAMAAVP